MPGRSHKCEQPNLTPASASSPLPHSTAKQAPQPDCGRPTVRAGGRAARKTPGHASLPSCCRKPQASCCRPSACDTFCTSWESGQARRRGGVEEHGFGRKGQHYQRCAGRAAAAAKERRGGRRRRIGRPRAQETSARAPALSKAHGKAQGAAALSGGQALTRDSKEVAVPACQGPSCGPGAAGVAWAAAGMQEQARAASSARDTARNGLRRCCHMVGAGLSGQPSAGPAGEGESGALLAAAAAAATGCARRAALARGVAMAWADDTGVAERPLCQP